MIARINLVVLIVATLLGLYFYVKRVGFKKTEIQNTQESLKVIKYQTLAELLMTLVGINYVVYFLYPIPLFMPLSFSWGWRVSATIAVAIALLSSYYWWRSLPSQPHPATILGTHDHFQDPQVLSDLSFWWVLGFLLHSPFLVMFSLMWIPIYFLFNWWEHKDWKTHKNLSTEC
jgi:preprotein translocase subunit YajC